MGCGASTPAKRYAPSEPSPEKAVRVAPRASAEPAKATSKPAAAETTKLGLESAATSVIPSESESASVRPATLQPTQGQHWAEHSPGVNRRVAAQPWVLVAEDEDEDQEGAALDTIAAALGSGMTCAPCTPTPQRRKDKYSFNCTFPMCATEAHTRHACTHMHMRICTPYTG